MNHKKPTTATKSQTRRKIASVTAILLMGGTLLAQSPAAENTVSEQRGEPVEFQNVVTQEQRAFTQVSDTVTITSKEADGTVHFVQNAEVQSEEAVTNATARGHSDAAGEKATDDSDWNLRLINRENPLASDFTVETTTLKNGEKVDHRIASALDDMVKAARAQGLSPVICSGYRTREKQQTLFDAQVLRFTKQGYTLQQAKEKAAQWVAIPGTSEHESGLAVDIVSLENQNLDETQADTPEQQWLMENAHRYGFILRYPDDKTDTTGITYEPWHYRFVGIEAAQSIYETGICLEEYCADLS